MPERVARGRQSCRIDSRFDDRPAHIPTCPWGGRSRMLAGALVIASVVWSSCALRRADGQDFGIQPCPTGADRDLLADDALQCWFTGGHGRWRMLGHQSHLDAMVVEVEARDLRDALPIAQRVVEGGLADAFAEVLVYVQAEEGRRVSRVRWTQRTGFETLDFSRPDVTEDAPS
jgi:hypothetical protein